MQDGWWLPQSGFSSTGCSPGQLAMGGPGVLASWYTRDASEYVLGDKDSGMAKITILELFVLAHHHPQFSGSNLSFQWAFQLLCILLVCHPKALKRRPNILVLGSIPTPATGRPPPPGKYDLSLPCINLLSFQQETICMSSRHNLTTQRMRPWSSNCGTSVVCMGAGP